MSGIRIAPWLAHRQTRSPTFLPSYDPSVKSLTVPFLQRHLFVHISLVAIWAEKQPLGVASVTQWSKFSYIQLKGKRISAWSCLDRFIYPASLSLWAAFGTMHLSQIYRIKCYCWCSPQCNADADERRPFDTFKLLSKYSLFGRPPPNEYTIEYCLLHYDFVKPKHHF